MRSDIKHQSAVLLGDRRSAGAHPDMPCRVHVLLRPAPECSPTYRQHARRPRLQLNRCPATVRVAALQVCVPQQAENQPLQHPPLLISLQRLRTYVCCCSLRCCMLSAGLVAASMFMDAFALATPVTTSNAITSTVITCNPKGPVLSMGCAQPTGRQDAQQPGQCGCGASKDTLDWWSTHLGAQT